MPIAQSLLKSMENASWIRQMFETGTRLKKLYGEDQVFDFSLGNPVLEPPPEVHAVLQQLLDSRQTGTHRYMPNGGFTETREYLAHELKAASGLPFLWEDTVLCVGAGGGLNVVFKALLDPDDEVLALAPYFVEYGFYAQNQRGKLVVAKTNAAFQPDLAAIEQALTPATKIVIINSPNNPTGAVYTQETLNQLGALLAQKEKEYGHAIFLVSDEPYRQLVFDGIVSGNVFLSHVNAIMVTSHSKDLGLAGERIGYIAIHPEMADRQQLQNGLVLATRILGFVNAPALMQRALPHLKGVRIDGSHYEHLRDILYEKLTALRFEVVKPQGAFYMFPRSPIPDDIAFVQQAQQENLLLVPGTGFGMPGYFRLAFCCTESQIIRSFARFERLMRQLGSI